LRPTEMPSGTGHNAQLGCGISSRISIFFCRLSIGVFVMKIIEMDYLRAGLSRFLLAGLLLLFLFNGAVLAESGWFTCKVDLAGPGKLTTFVALSDQANKPAFSGKWFVLPEDRARAMLAVALVAINSNRQVVAVVDPKDGDYPEITDLYILAGQ